MVKRAEEAFKAPKPVREIRKDPVTAGRICSKCGQEARIVANYEGVTAFCDHCRLHWGISGPRIIPLQVFTTQRGLERQVLAPSDPSIAFEPDTEDQPHERKLWEESDD